MGNEWKSRNPHSAPRESQRPSVLQSLQTHGFRLRRGRLDVVGILPPKHIPADTETYVRQVRGTDTIGRWEMSPKPYRIPDDVAAIFEEYMACTEIRDSAVKVPFGYRKAKRASRERIRAHRLFWKRVGEVYPELDDESLVYDSAKRNVYIKGEVTEEEASR